MDIGSPRGTDFLCEFDEPGVIDRSMLINLITNQGPQGEAGRLFREDGIEFDKVTHIRIEFLNILKIDYLWVLKNLVVLKLTNNIIEQIENLDELEQLKELDLSFNRIKVIENLNHLTKLEVLLLYNNEISVIKGIDDLKELRILNIGKNKISDWEHIKYLRKFANLYAFNATGNPCADLTGYTDYLFALMPQLIYYQYKMITKEEKLKAAEKHYCDLSTLSEIQEREQVELEAERIRAEQLIFHTEAYVEYLDEDYLFELLFENDKEGELLSMVNEETQNAFKEYKKQFSPISHELYQIGLREYKKRNDEIRLFHETVNEGKKSLQEKGRSIIDNIMEQRQIIISHAKGILKKIKNGVDNAAIEDIVKTVKEISDDFDQLLSDAWSKLMSNEAILHDQIEDVNEVFRINLKDMVDSFLESAQSFFSQLRNCDAEYNDTINALILYHLSGLGEDAKMPDHLMNVCGDKDILTNNLATSRDAHLKVIDGREESMVTRLNNWFEKYTEDLVEYETKRNNDRILEISYFMEIQQELIDALQLIQEMNIEAFDGNSIFP